MDKQQQQLLRQLQKEQKEFIRIPAACISADYWCDSLRINLSEQLEDSTLQQLVDM